jgi:hypothetical protein
LVSAVQILAIAIAAFAIFRLGSLWSFRGFAQVVARLGLVNRGAP